MSNLEAYSDARSVARSVRCECGNRKNRCAEACARCGHLDGQRNAALIISALRGTDGLSIREICNHLGLVYQHSLRGPARSIHRTLMSMLGTGRVRRYWRDEDARQIEGVAFRNRTQTLTVACGGAWVYALDGRAE